MLSVVKKVFIFIGFGLLIGSSLFFAFDPKSLVEENFFSENKLPPFLNEHKIWSDSVYNSLSLEEKIGQMIMVAAYPNKGEQDIERVTALIKNYKVGGIIFFQGTTQQVADLTKYYQSISKTPLLIAIDGEWGLAMRLSDGIQYPKQMTLGAITDEKLIYQMGCDIAKQLKHIGIHINFAPVVDINNNPENPVINSRSFGELRVNTARKGILYMKGLQDEGVLAFAKHFPGHGDTKTDSHKELPIIEHSLARLDSVELYPFRALINAGVAGIMTAHMNVISLDSTPDLPSTLSPIIVDSLLQKRLAFKGLVVTDAMEMKGLANYFSPVEANIMAIQAGNNIILMPAEVENTLPAVLSAIDSGDISIKSIEHSCKKILEAKEWVLIKAEHEKYNADSLHKSDYLLIRQSLIEASLTVLKNTNSLIPLQRLDTLKIATINIGPGDAHEFQSFLTNYANIQSFTISRKDNTKRINDVLDSLKAFNLIMVSLHSNGIRASSNFNINQDETKLLDSILNYYPSLLISFANPYSLRNLKHLDSSRAILIAYEDDSVSQNAATHLIFGAIGAKGKLPVSISEKYSAGCGIQTPELKRFKYVDPFEAGFDKVKLQFIDSIINEAIREKAMPGCQVFAARNGKVFLNKSYGYHTYYTHQPVTNNDLFDLASLTKISATVPSLMRLEGENKFASDSNLSYFFPSLDTCEKGKLLISDILLHQAGLEAWVPFYWSTLEPVYPGQDLMSTVYSDNYPIQVGPRVFINKHIKFKDNYYATYQSSEYPFHVADGLYLRKDIADTMWVKIINSEIDNPGHYRYSDLGFYIFQKFIEQTTHKSLDKFTDSVFYRSLGAYTLCFNPLERFSRDNIIPTENDLVFRRQQIHGYVHDPGAAMLGGVSGHAGLFGSANDLAKIMQMYLNGGTYGGIEYLHRNIISKYTSCVACYNGNRRGLGFDKPQPDTNIAGPAFNGISTNSYGHTGFTGTITWADPDTGILYVFLSNRVYPDALNNQLVKLNVRTRVHKAIYDARIVK